MPGAGSTLLHRSTTSFRPYANQLLSDVPSVFVSPHRSLYEDLSPHDAIGYPDSLVSARHPDKKERRILPYFVTTTGSCRARIRCCSETGTNRAEKAVLRLRRPTRPEFRPPNRCRGNTQ